MIPKRVLLCFLTAITLQPIHADEGSFTRTSDGVTVRLLAVNNGAGRTWNLASGLLSAEAPDWSPEDVTRLLDGGDVQTTPNGVPLRLIAVGDRHGLWWRPDGKVIGQLSVNVEPAHGFEVKPEQLERCFLFDVDRPAVKPGEGLKYRDPTLGVLVQGVSTSRQQFGLTGISQFELLKRFHAVAQSTQVAFDSAIVATSISVRIAAGDWQDAATITIEPDAPTSPFGSGAQEHDTLDDSAGTASLVLADVTKASVRHGQRTAIASIALRQEGSLRDEYRLIAHRLIDGKAGVGVMTGNYTNSNNGHLLLSINQSLGEPILTGGYAAWPPKAYRNPKPVEFRLSHRPFEHVEFQNVQLHPAK